MKKSHFELKNYVTATSVFVLAVVAGILIFFKDQCGKTERASVDDSGYQLSVSE